MTITIFKLDVKKSCCFYCHKPIGESEYVEIETFGVVPFVAHKECNNKALKEKHFVGNYT